MSGYRVDLNLREVRAELAKAAESGMKLGLEHLLTEANKRVPHDEGTLERSGSTDVDGLKGAVSYDTPYAVMQHETLGLVHDGKGEAKWLENTFTQEGKTVGRIIATSMRGELP